MWNSPEEISAAFGPDNMPFYHGNSRSILEMAYTYSQREKLSSVMILANDGYDDASTFESRLKRLSDDGFVDVRTSMDDKEKGYYKIDSMALTASGEQMLISLRNNDFLIKFRNNIFSLFWVISTSILTTLVVLKLQGN